MNSEPEKYYHAKILHYFPWHNEDELIDGFSSYHHSYLSKQETIQENAKLFNDDCELFDLSQEDLGSNTMQTVWDLVLDSNTMQTVWDLVAPTIVEDDAVTNKVAG